MFYWIYIRKAIKMKIMTKTGDGWRIVKEVDAAMNAHEKKWGKDTYHINLDMAYLDKRQNPILHYELHRFDPIQTGFARGKFDAQALQNILDNHDLADLKHGEKEKILVYVIIGCVVVIGIVAGVGYYFNSQTSAQIVELSKQFAATIQNVTKGNGGAIIP